MATDDETKLTRRAALVASAAMGTSLVVAGCGATRPVDGDRDPSRRSESMVYDVVIAGGGPAGLSAALALGRARRRVLLVDGGPRRNAAATHVHNFLTRDGTPPEELRRIGREQLATYPRVELRDGIVGNVTGSRGAFRMEVDGRPVEARRLLLATGMIDEMLPVEGFRALWGTSIVQCPYCHGWEVQDRAWGVLVTPGILGHLVPFALMLRAWTREVTVFAAGTSLPEEQRSALVSRGIALEDAPVERLHADHGHIAAVELQGGRRVRCEVLFAHPPQRQVPLVGELGLALSSDGFVEVDPMRRETSVPGVYAAGDAITRGQGAILGAAAGTMAAGGINVDLAMDPSVDPPT